MCVGGGGVTGWRAAAWSSVHDFDVPTYLTLAYLHVDGGLPQAQAGSGPGAILHQNKLHSLLGTVD